MGASQFSPTISVRGSFKMQFRTILFLYKGVLSTLLIGSKPYFLTVLLSISFNELPW